jgi:tRNA G18 (ribose-2'-O)-methylase SpoU
MLGGAESLNASVAGSVMMYEFVRQNKTYIKD